VRGLPNTRLDPDGRSGGRASGRRLAASRLVRKRMFVWCGPVARRSTASRSAAAIKRCASRESSVKTSGLVDKAWQAYYADTFITTSETMRSLR
jgi:hypothetical protein